MVAHVHSPIIAKVIWDGDSRGERDPAQNKLGGEKQLLKLSSDLHMCTATSASGRVPVSVRAGAVVNSRMQCSAEGRPSFPSVPFTSMNLMRQYSILN